jgi:CBS domain-containing protein
MDVRDGMNRTVVTVGPEHTLREAARRMTRADVGAAVVIDPDGIGPGILTERDLLHACGAGDDLDSELVKDHLTQRLTYAAADWSLERAAEEMVRARFRHVVVVDGSEVVGILSMRDIVRCWTQSGATSTLDVTAMGTTEKPIGSAGLI